MRIYEITDENVWTDADRQRARDKEDSINRARAKSQDTMNQPVGNSIATDGHIVKFTSDGMFIYRGSELVDKAEGDFSNPTKRDFASARGRIVRLHLNKKQEDISENFADGKVKGKSRPGRVKKAGASCKGSVTDLRAKARKYGGEKGKMYHWCANMKGGKK